MGSGQWTEGKLGGEGGGDVQAPAAPSLASLQSGLVI